jgi:hemoglobin
MKTMNKLTSTITLGVISAVLTTTVGCRSGAQKKKDEFFTSGSREADQRATQRMAKDQQLAAGGTSAGSKTDQGDARQTLFERLGSQQGLTAIVDDFTARALEDPRVNWQRKGVGRGGLLRRDQPATTWTASPENVARLKKHVVQFLALATGGPANYDGKDIKTLHAGMQITNPEFDAAIGDLKASLDKLRISDREQKELLAIIESTRPQIVTER